jgi:hypothetical protein
MLLHDFSNWALILEVVTPAATDVHRSWKRYIAQIQILKIDPQAVTRFGSRS